MKLKPTRTFNDDFKCLPKKIREKCKKQLKLLLYDYRYPSLRTEKIEGTKNIFAARVDIKYRFSFQVEHEYYILRTVGDHDKVLKNP